MTIPPIGALGILCMTGTGGVSANRFLNPLTLDVHGRIDWNFYDLRTRDKANRFGVTRRMIWMPVGTDPYQDLCLDGWLDLYKDALERNRASHQFASCFGRGDTAYLGSVLRFLPGYDYNTVIDRCLCPFINCDRIVFDASSKQVGTSWIYGLASALENSGMNTGTESMIGRATAWHNDLQSSMWIESQGYLRYNRPVGEWENSIDKQELVPIHPSDSEVQCPICVFSCGEWDTAGTSPTAADAAQILALGRDLYVAPDSAGLWRGKSAAQITAMARAIQQQARGAGT